MCSVRLMQNRGRILDACLLVSAYEGVILDAAECDLDCMLKV